MYGKLILPLAFLSVPSRCTHLPAWVSSSVVLHTPISKVLGNSRSVAARNCGALLAVCCNRAAIAAGVLPPRPAPSFLSEILFCSDPTTSRLSNSSRLVGENEGNWNSLLQKNVKLSIFPPPHTFALQLCAGPLPCSALFVSGRLGNAVQLLRADSLALVVGLQRALLLRPPVPDCQVRGVAGGFSPTTSLPSQLFFKLFIACGAMGFPLGLHLGSLDWVAEGLGSDVKTKQVQKAGLRMGALGLQCSALPSKL